MQSHNDLATMMPSLPTMCDSDFEKLSRFIYDYCGIKITAVKKVMIESRLTKRLKALGISNFKEYCSYLFSASGMSEELVHMIDLVTTNKTDFFREPTHFHHMTSRAVPELMKNCGAGTRRKLMVWSAGCSTGEEPYTIAMVLHELKEKYHRFDYGVLATDISTKVLEAAKLAIYDEQRVAPVPDCMKRKYLLKGKDDNTGKVRIRAELRSAVEFRKLNFMDEDFGIRERMDIIFCRNVIIYFDRQTQERLLRRFCEYLLPGGFFFTGHSENLNGMDVPLISVAPTTYRKI